MTLGPPRSPCLARVGRALAAPPLGSPENSPTTRGGPASVFVPPNEVTDTATAPNITSSLDPARRAFRTIAVESSIDCKSSPHQLANAAVEPRRLMITSAAEPPTAATAPAAHKKGRCPSRRFAHCSRADTQCRESEQSLEERQREIARSNTHTLSCSRPAPRSRSVARSRRPESSS